jgi:NTE family protein
MVEEARNREVMRSFVDIINSGGTEAFSQIFAENVKNHNRFAGQAEGLAGLRQASALIAEAFPDWHEVFEDIITDGDKVVVRATVRATHLGPFMGLPPTGKKVSTSANTIFRLEDGKVVEVWLNDDNILAGFLLQILGTHPRFDRSA